jgi:gliding motility-associated-like protein
MAIHLKIENKVQKSLTLLFFIVLMSAEAQVCTSLVSPVNGAVDVPLDATITWSPVNGVAGYIISLGTTPGGSELVNNQAVGLSTSFTPPLGLPNNTTIYVNISLFFFNSQNIPCQEESFTTENITTPPACTMLNNPLNGAVDVPINANLSWNVSIGAEGYRLTIGNTPGGNEILAETDLGNVLTYNPAVNFQPATTIFVTLVPYNSNGNAAGCTIESFTTGSLGQAPECTSLLSPLDGAFNVSLSPELRWIPVPNATGYILNMGTSPGARDILNNFDTGNSTATVVLNFEFNVTIFVTITPYNDAGQAVGCNEERFSTSAGCGPYLDPDTGLIVNLRPVIVDPDRIVSCTDTFPFTYVSETIADGYIWYAFDNNGDEFELATERTVNFEEQGNYRLVAYTEIIIEGEPYRCESSKEVQVVATGEKPSIRQVRLEEIGNLVRIFIEVSGTGDYEYALNDSNGPYQDANFFDLTQVNAFTVHVRDKNGCGSVSREIISVLFPKFFTPNSDAINDFWNIRDDEINDIPVKKLQIFDRYGRFVASFSPQESGWDGTFNGQPLPAADYWYAAHLENGSVFKGHFSLKR